MNGKPFADLKFLPNLILAGCVLGLLLSLGPSTMMGQWQRNVAAREVAHFWASTSREQAQHRLPRALLALRNSEAASALPNYGASQLTRLEALDSVLALDSESETMRPVQLFAELSQAAGQRDTVAEEQALGRLASLQPAYPLGRVTKTGWQPEPQEVMPGWQLLGYDLDGAPVLHPWTELQIALYWERNRSVAAGAIQVNNWRFMSAGHRVYQIGPVTNLLQNGSFEDTRYLSDPLPLGIEYMEYVPNRPGDSSLVYAQRGAATTAVAYLDNRWRNGSGYRTELLNIHPDRRYLQAAWVRTEGSSTACLANGWEPHETVGTEWYAYQWCGQGGTWAHVAAVIEPFPGASQVRLWLDNRGGGQVYFDDVLFIELDLTPLTEVP